MKVLICVNDLLVDEPGLIFGGKLAQDLQSEITLLHILSKNKLPGDRDRGEQLLRDARQILGGYPANLKVRRGDIIKRIIKETERGDYDMVIITVSKIGEGRTPVSSVHRSLFRDLPCCLLVIKNPKAEINRMLICTGGLQMAESLIEVSASVAGAVGADATLFHVAANIPSMYTGLGSIEETLLELLQTDTPVARHLRRSAEILAEKNVEAELKLRHGEAVYEIVREIDREHYDLVVIGASGADSRIKTWFYGNLSHNLVDAIGIPVLVVNQTTASQKPKFKS